MLLSLITIKIVEFVKMVREIISVESYRLYFRELGGALKLEFAELNLVAQVRDEAYALQQKLGLLRKGIKDEVTALTPLATKAVVAAKELKAQLRSKTSPSSEAAG